MEVLSLFRVMNSYYQKKTEIQVQLRPTLFKKFKESLSTIKKNEDWLYSLPSALNALSQDLLSKKDSFRFPDGILLFEAWMNLGLKALFPKVVLHFKFPGFLKGEKYRNVFQFIYSFSRGFGFPIYFNPEFYGYKSIYIKILDPLFKWSYTVWHKANQAILLVDKKIKSKRHHPGDFESVIISEYKNNKFKRFDTLLHGYFTRMPQNLGEYSSLDKALENIKFNYTIGDHAIKVGKFSAQDKLATQTLKIPLIDHQKIAVKYEIDFYPYIKDLLNLNKLIYDKIIIYDNKIKRLVKSLDIFDKLLYYIKKIIPLKKYKRNIPVIERYKHQKQLLKKIKEYLWTRPLFTHTIHTPTKQEKVLLYDQDTADSILLSIIKRYEKRYNFTFEEKDIIDALKNLRDQMGKMWLYFKERQFNYAHRKLQELSSLTLNNSDYRTIISNDLDNLIPIFSIYEIFNRSLAESVYPESIQQNKRLGYYLAKFFAWKYNPIGISFMNLFNKLAYNNWSYFIKNRDLKYKDFFELMLKLPIWKYIPINVKNFILKN